MGRYTWCRCLQRPEALDSSVTASTGDCESIKMAARNEIWASARAVNVLTSKAVQSLDGL